MPRAELEFDWVSSSVEKEEEGVILLIRMREGDRERHTKREKERGETWERRRKGLM